MRITVRQLERLGACDEQVSLFALYFGRSAEVTMENCLAAAELGLSLGWAAHALLPRSACAVYEAAMVSAVWTYRAATKPAMRVYQTAVSLAQAAYATATASVKSVYDDAVVRAQAAHHAAVVPAGEAFDVAVAPAKAVYYAAAARAFYKASKGGAR